MVEWLDAEIREQILSAHRKRRGKIEIVGKVMIKDSRDLAFYYTPGVAAVSKAISENADLSYEYTSRGNTIAIISDGTRVLGLGDLGPEAEMPILEGKTLLFKKFGGVDAIPICIGSKSEDDIVKFVEMIKPSVAAINIEDIEMPKAFNITRKLEERLKLPLFHDDRSGTAIVVRAALINALSVVGKNFRDIKVVINGAGAAGIGVAEILCASKVRSIIVCDTAGAIYEGRQNNMNEFKEIVSKVTNAGMEKGNLSEVVKGADVLIGVSHQHSFTKEMIKTMAKSPIIFALANPDPEIDYQEAKDAGAAIVATGRSDIPNQVNNYIAFPGLFRGLLSSHASKITNDMIMAASDAIASYVKKSERSESHIIPKFGNIKEYTALTIRIATRVAAAAVDSGAAKAHPNKNQIKNEIKMMLSMYNKIEKNIERLNQKYDAND